MKLFVSSWNQVAFLIFIIIIGYALTRFKIVESHTAEILSKLENNIFIPALVINAFMNNLTIETLKTSWQYMLCGLIVIVTSSLFAVPVSRLFTREEYERKLYTYGLSFSNFGFMGNAVVSSLFPDLFMSYLLYTLPISFLQFIWAVPNLLIPSEAGDSSNRLKRLFNPMFLAVIIGTIIGLFNLPIPRFIDDAISSLGSCMSPVAMLLTGITIGGMKLDKLFTRIPVYFASILRLLILPVAGVLTLKVFGIPYSLSLCAVCFLAMPLGLNTIVIPEAYGKDTSLGASMALISHFMSLFTIPLILHVFNILF